MKAQTNSRLLVLILLLSAWSGTYFTAAPRQDSGAAIIGGRVLADATGEPIAKASVEVVRIEAQRAVLTRVVTDERGVFQAKGLLPGRYELRATAEGFVPSSQTGPSTVVLLSDGEKFSSADFKLVKTSTIEGTIVDSMGAGIPNVRIQMVAALFISGKYILLPLPNQRAGMSDDRGNFHIGNIRPGEHYMVATSGAFAGRPDEPAYPAGFYPTGTLASGPQPLAIRPGSDLRGLRMTLPVREPADVFGVTVDDAGNPLGQALVVLVEATGGLVNAAAPGRTVSGPDGRFAFRNVAAGRYLVQATVPVQGRTVFGSSEVLARRAAPGSAGPGIDSRLVVQVRPGVSIHGRVELVGSAARPKDADISVSYVQTNYVFLPRPLLTTTELSGGAFEIRDVVSDGLFRLEAPHPWGLERVEAAGQVITDIPIEVRGAEVDGVKLILTDRMARITGTVENAGHAVAGAAVVVFSVDEKNWGFPSRFVRTAAADSAGRYVISGVVPGPYLVIALPSVEMSQWYDPDFLRRVRAHAVRADLADRQQLQRSLQLQRADR